MIAGTVDVGRLDELSRRHWNEGIYRRDGYFLKQMATLWRGAAITALPPRLLVPMASAFIADNDDVGAVTLAKQAILATSEWEPLYQVTLLNAALVLYMTHEHSSALQFLLTLVETPPLPLCRPYLHALMALCHAHAGDKKRAKTMLAAIERCKTTLPPSDAGFWVALATELSTRGCHAISAHLLLHVLGPPFDPVPGHLRTCATSLAPPAMLLLLQTLVASPNPDSSLVRRVITAALTSTSQYDASVRDLIRRISPEQYPATDFRRHERTATKLQRWYHRRCKTPRGWLLLVVHAFRTYERVGGYVPPPRRDLPLEHVTTAVDAPLVLPPATSDDDDRVAWILERAKTIAARSPKRPHIDVKPIWYCDLERAVALYEASRERYFTHFSVGLYELLEKVVSGLERQWHGSTTTSRFATRILRQLRAADVDTLGEDLETLLALATTEEARRNVAFRQLVARKL
ncbi:hypothetical protein SDRG_06438 [Saprolegnia diclina VS20]|uniref:Uncharacterized protein n=1 Tax=Saprolegnia diclina (strain VS20) TaxID=1156394 RepID=T0RV13_SAPDV|nr:hypothetical protein SDRG_06438 [Saprolegnia diclina VS20]EQC36333.1 hypothetical protein SDRG_06438 [Saprolegnia diclina VS20]|eukprot:XP_008610439.1 hypothetical protein SDRG_06438 [Saprolegnia diclina VS20]